MEEDKVANHASALGEAVGSIMDDAVFGIVKASAEEGGFTVKRSGDGVRLVLIDSDGTIHL